MGRNSAGGESGDRSNYPDLPAISSEHHQIVQPASWQPAAFVSGEAKPALRVHQGLDYPGRVYPWGRTRVASARAQIALIGGRHRPVATPGLEAMYNPAWAMEGATHEQDHDAVGVYCVEAV